MPTPAPPLTSCITSSSLCLTLLICKIKHNRPYFTELRGSRDMKEGLCSPVSDADPYFCPSLQGLADRKLRSSPASPATNKPQASMTGTSIPLTSSSYPSEKRWGNFALIFPSLYLETTKSVSFQLIMTTLCGREGIWKQRVC